jgi:hypothetical protein
LPSVCKKACRYPKRADKKENDQILNAHCSFDYSKRGIHMKPNLRTLSDMQGTWAQREARTLLWVFPEKEAREHITRNLERTKKGTDFDCYAFWRKVETNFEDIVKGRTSKLDELIYLLNFVERLEPHEQFIDRVIKHNSFQDLRTQLLTIMEDMKKQ